MKGGIEDIDGLNKIKGKSEKLKRKGKYNKDGKESLPGSFENQSYWPCSWFLSLLLVPKQLKIGRQSESLNKEPGSIIGGGGRRAQIGPAEENCLLQGLLSLKDLYATLSSLATTFSSMLGEFELQWWSL